MKSLVSNISIMILSIAVFAFASPVKAEVTIMDESQADTQADTKEVALKDAIVPIQPAPVWILTGGHSVGQDLKVWGDKAGWKVIWNISKDWTVPASTQFSGEFPVVAADVIKTLASNGALIHAQLFEGNKTMVVTGPGVSE